MMTLIKKILNTIRKRISGPKWQDIEYFDVLWRARIELMSGYIPNGASVLDLGCGKMWLKDFIHESDYYPVDYTSRGIGTIICDFNKDPFPDIYCDVSFVSGCLEYVLDYKAFIRNIAKYSKTCIISYCTTEDYSDTKERNALAWVNHLSYNELIGIFKDNGMKLIEEAKFQEKSSVFVFSRGNNSEGSQ